MDVNKMVDSFEKAIKRNDVDEAVVIDTKLAIYEQQIVETLKPIPAEHSETMGFYFRDWIMNNFDEFILIGLIAFAFLVVENQVISWLLGLTGAFFLVTGFLRRRHYAGFVAKDLWRMRNEKMAARDFQMQLNYIRECRHENSEFIQQAIIQKLDANDRSPEETLKSMMPDAQTILDEMEKEYENQKDTEDNSSKQ